MRTPSRSTIKPRFVPKPPPEPFPDKDGDGAHDDYQTGPGVPVEVQSGRTMPGYGGLINSPIGQRIAAEALAKIKPGFLSDTPPAQRPRPGQPSSRFPAVPNDPIPDDANAVLAMLKRLPKTVPVDMSNKPSAGKTFNSQIAKREQELLEKAASLGMNTTYGGSTGWEMKPAPATPPAPANQTPPKPSESLMQNSTAPVQSSAPSGTGFVNAPKPTQAPSSGTGTNFFDQIREETKQQETANAAIRERAKKDDLENRGGNELNQSNDLKRKAKDLAKQYERAKADGNGELAAGLLKTHKDYAKQSSDLYDQYREKSGLAQAGRQQKTLGDAQAWQSSISRMLAKAGNDPVQILQVEKEIEKMKETPNGKFFQAVLSANSSHNLREVEKLTNDYHEELKKRPSFVDKGGGRPLENPVNYSNFPYNQRPQDAVIGSAFVSTNISRLPVPSSPIAGKGSLIAGKPGAIADGKGGFSYSKGVAPLNALDQLTQARDIHGNEVKTADMLTGGGIKLQKQQRAEKKDSSGLSFRMIDGKVQITGSGGPRATSDAELPQSMGQTQPGRTSTAKRSTALKGMR